MNKEKKKKEKLKKPEEISLGRGRKIDRYFSRIMNEKEIKKK